MKLATSNFIYFLNKITSYASTNLRKINLIKNMWRHSFFAQIDFKRKKNVVVPSFHCYIHPAKRLTYQKLLAHRAQIYYYIQHIIGANITILSAQNIYLFILLVHHNYMQYFKQFYHIIIYQSDSYIAKIKIPQRSSYVVKYYAISLDFHLIKYSDL